MRFLLKFIGWEGRIGSLSISQRFEECQENRRRIFPKVVEQRKSKMGYMGK